MKTMYLAMEDGLFCYEEGFTTLAFYHFSSFPPIPSSLINNYFDA
jgi:hypothetical protein